MRFRPSSFAGPQLINADQWGVQEVCASLAFRLSIAQKSFDLEETYHHEHQKHAPYVFDAYQAIMFRYVHIGTNIFSHTHVNSSSLHNYALNHLLYKHLHFNFIYKFIEMSIYTYM